MVGGWETFGFGLASWLAGLLSALFLDGRRDRAAAARGSEIVRQECLRLLGKLPNGAPTLEHVVAIDEYQSMPVWRVPPEMDSLVTEAIIRGPIPPALIPAIIKLRNQLRNVRHLWEHWREGCLGGKEEGKDAFVRRLEREDDDRWRALSDAFIEARDLASELLAESEKHARLPALDRRLIRGG